MQTIKRPHRIFGPLLVTALAMASTAYAHPTESVTGTLHVARYGHQGQPVILIPGLEGGSWVWQDTIAHLEKNHVVYTVTLAGFDGTPAPAHHSELLDQADASLLDLIEHQKIARPVLVGHSLGGTLALRFASEHPQLISGVVAVDGLPILPGMDQVSADQRQVIAAQTRDGMDKATPEQFKTMSLDYMRTIGVIDPQLAERYATMNARSDSHAAAEYLYEDMLADLRPMLKNARVPILEISPYYAPDFSRPPMQYTEQQKTGYYESLLTNAPNAKVVSVSPSRHYVMFDQPNKFQQILDSFLDAH